MLASKRLLTIWTRFPWFSGVLLSCAIALPWYVAAELKNPGFLEYFIIGEHFYRYTDSGWEGDQYGNAHIRPLGTIWIRFLQSGAPWSFVIAFIAAKFIWNYLKGERQPISDWHFFLWSWLLMPLIFFTFSKNLIWTYVLPATSPMALILADRWKDNWANRSPRWILLTSSIVPALMLVVAIAFSMDKGQPSHKHLLKAVYETQSENPGEIIYWQKRPFSGRYYSQGQSLLIESSEELTQVLNNGKQNFLIAQKWSFDSLPTPIRQRFTLQNEYREWGYWLGD